MAHSGTFLCSILFRIRTDTECKMYFFFLPDRLCFVGFTLALDPRLINHVGKRAFFAFILFFTNVLLKIRSYVWNVTLNLLYATALLPNLI